MPPVVNRAESLPELSARFVFRHKKRTSWEGPDNPATAAFLSTYSEKILPHRFRLLRRLTPGSPGTEMDLRLIKVPGAKTFTKNRSDAFSTLELDAYLRENHVDRLLLTGLDGAYCVDATARGALNRGYQVTLFQDGIATESNKSIEKLAHGWREAGAQVKTGTEM